MFTTKVDLISTEQKYNVQLSIPFIICICIMIFEKFFLIFDNFPELFAGGDIIYHAVANILSIITQLAASVAAAIIFYYCTEFLNKKKDMEIYCDMRRELLITIYFIMDLFERFDSFSAIKCSNTNKRWHDVYDIEPFCNCLKCLDNKKDYQILKEQLQVYIHNNLEDFHGNIKMLRSNVEKLYKSAKHYRYFRNSYECAEEIQNIFEELNTTFVIYNDNVGKDEIDETEALVSISENLIAFVQKYVNYEIKLGTMVSAINKKQIFNFMRLLD